MRQNELIKRIIVTFQDGELLNIEKIPTNIIVEARKLHGLHERIFGYDESDQDVYVNEKGQKFTKTVWA